MSDGGVARGRAVGYAAAERLLKSLYPEISLSTGAKTSDLEPSPPGGPEKQIMPLHLRIEKTRLAASKQLDPDRRVSLGQFMTPSAIATFMASLFKRWPDDARVLDPGAGIGSLSEAFARKYMEMNPRGRLHLTAYEIDPVLVEHLGGHLRALGPTIEHELFQRDFIREATSATSFGARRFSHVILNPPYKKIGGTSDYRKLLRTIGVETGNLYSAFLALAVAMTDDQGEIVGIVPRSFCNGTYFRPFRSWLLSKAALTHVHVFESRKKAFSDDNVLQENIIIRLQRGGSQGSVAVSSSHDSTLHDYQERQVPFVEIVNPIDAQQFIHVPTFETNGSAKLFACSLAELGLGVATGPVVDFRLRPYSHSTPKPGMVPLLYAHHFSGGTLQWPREHKKPNALEVNGATRKWLMPQGWYAVTKRFSAKEEKRRLVAYVVDPARLPHEFYGFENHLNVIHSGKNGIAPALAHGIALFLNSTVVDLHFRNFSGHTQVNATDLRSMRFPNLDVLTEFGKWAATHRNPSQQQIDQFIESFDGD
jgi:tRNA1(Val) A37 N6-methylase TrmN6